VVVALGTTSYINPAIESGIIIFYVKSGELSKRARLEVLLDSGYWPAFSTTRAHGHHAAWQHVGEGFVKEIDFGRVWLRLNEADEGEKDIIVGEWKDDVKPFLSRTLVWPFLCCFQRTTLDDCAQICRVLQLSLS